MDTPDFSGQWHYNKFYGENSIDNMEFYLQLNQKKDSITGFYCSSSRNGNRVDCFDEKDQNIKGKIDNDTLYIDFKSNFNDQIDNAKLYFKDKKLYWKITKSEGLNYLHSEMILEKK